MDPKKLLRNAQDLIDNLPKPERVERVSVTKKRKRGSFIKGTFIGAAIGAVAALLLAPKSGKQTRKHISKHGKRLAGQATDQAGKLKDQAVGQAGKLKDSAADVAGQAKKTASKTAKRATKKATGTAKKATRRSPRRKR